MEEDRFRLPIARTMSKKANATATPLMISGPHLFSAGILRDYSTSEENDSDEHNSEDEDGTSDPECLPASVDGLLGKV